MKLCLFHEREEKTIISPGAQGTVPCRPRSSHGDKSQKGRSVRRHSLRSFRAHVKNFCPVEDLQLPPDLEAIVQGIPEDDRPPECPACNGNGSSRTSDTYYQVAPRSKDKVKLLMVAANLYLAVFRCAANIFAKFLPVAVKSHHPQFFLS